MSWGNFFYKCCFILQNLTILNIFPEEKFSFFSIVIIFSLKIVSLIFSMGAIFDIVPGKQFSHIFQNETENFKK